MGMEVEGTGTERDGAGAAAGAGAGSGAVVGAEDVDIVDVVVPFGFHSFFAGTGGRVTLKCSSLAFSAASSFSLSALNL